MKKKLLTIVSTIFICAIPVYCIVNGQPLTDVLRDLRSELKMTVEQSVEEQVLFEKDYERQHERMVNVITASNELSLLLYTQEQQMTFDLAYALKKVSSAYHDFNKDRKPYDRIVHELNLEVDRYARLIESLRRIPPIMTEIEIEILPDSLLYHVDSLDQQYSELASSLEKEVIRIAVKDSLSSPFVLDEEGEVHRDSCIMYASELLKRHVSNRDSMIADSTHYQAAYWRMTEAYDYAQSRYRELEKYVFVDGQEPFMVFLADPKGSWNKIKVALHNQYDFSELGGDDSQPADSLAVSPVTGEEIVLGEEEDADLFTGLSSKGANSMLVLVTVKTEDGTEMSFLNASLFGKNFNNLTRNNSYELTVIKVGVAYGTDIAKVREVLVDGMQKMRTKDHYGREIVEPKHGVYVVVKDMSDSSVDIAVKQYVLVAERIGYVDRAKEVIYESLNNAGITIPFPQCDVHLKHDD